MLVEVKNRAVCRRAIRSRMTAFGRLLEVLAGIPHGSLDGGCASQARKSGVSAVVKKRRLASARA